MLAALRGDIATLKLLLSIPGIDPNTTIEGGHTALTIAIGNKQSEIVKLLVEDPRVDINKGRDDGYTALHLASYIGDLESVKHLINEPKIEINYAHPSGNTALMLAASEGKFEVVKVLAAVPYVDFQKKNMNSQTAYDMAANRRIRSYLSVSQSVINKQFQKYLKLKAKPGKGTYNDSDIKAIIENIEGGQCSGLSALWVYHKLSGEQSQFFGNLRFIAQWDGELESLKSNEGFLLNIFEQMLSDAQWVQEKSEMMKGVKGQQDLTNIFQTIKHARNSESINAEFQLNFILKKPELAEVLQNIMNDRKMVFLGGINHAMAATFIDGKYYAYDPNEPQGEMEFDTIQELQNYIEKCLFGRFNFTTETMPMCINVFDFESNERFPYKKSGSQMVESFIQRNNDVNRMKNYPSLGWACNYGDIEVVRTLLKQKDIELTSGGNYNPITAASEHGYKEIVYELIHDKRANLADFFNAMLVAALNDHDDCVKILAEALKIDMKDPWVRLMLASAKGNVDELNEIIKNEKVNINKKDPNGYFALYWAFRKNLKIFTELVKNNYIEINIQTPNGDTPLIASAKSDNYDAIIVLLENPHIDVNIVNDYGWTALMVAASNGHYKNVKLLIDSNKVNNENIWKVYLIAVSELKNSEETDLILNYLSNRLNLNNKNADNKFLIAVNKDDSEECRNLLKTEIININRSDICGYSPLLWASLRGLADVLNELLTVRNIEINKRDPNGYTAIMHALHSNDPKLIHKFLSVPGIDLTIKDNKGLTVFDFAKQHGNPEIIKLIQEAIEKHNKEMVDRPDIADNRGETLIFTQKPVTREEMSENIEKQKPEL